MPGTESQAALAVLLIFLLLLVVTWGLSRLKAIPRGVRHKSGPDLVAAELQLVDEPSAALPPPRCRGLRGSEKKLSFPACTMQLEELQWKISAHLVFKLDIIKSWSEGRTKVILGLDQVDVDILPRCAQICSNVGRLHGGQRRTEAPFIYKMVFHVLPGSWACYCDRMTMQPHQTSETFEFQQGRGLSVRVGGPSQTSIVSNTENTTGRKASEFEWSPARKDESSKSISWTWKVSRCRDGSRLELNKGKYRWGAPPQVGMQPIYMHPGSFAAAASWEIRPEGWARMQRQWLAWDVELQLHPALVKRTRLYPGYFIDPLPIVSFETVLRFQ